MSLELRGVSKRVGAETHIHETTLTLAPEGFNVLLGADRRRQDHPDQADGRPRAADDRRDPVPRQERHRGHPAQAQRQPGAPVLHQLPDHDRRRQHRLAAAGRRPGEGRDRPPRPRDRGAPAPDPDARRRPQQLSGGQQQRTALARAIVKASDLVLLDEPLANLDYKLREELRDQLPRLFAGRGASSSTPPPSPARR